MPSNSSEPRFPSPLEISEVGIRLRKAVEQFRNIPPIDREIEERLSEIRGSNGQFSILQDICNAHLENAQSDIYRLLRQLDIVQVPRSLFGKETGAPTGQMSIHPGTGVILVNSEQIRNENRGEIQMPILHYLCHEIVHGLSPEWIYAAEGRDIMKVQGVAVQNIPRVEKEGGPTVRMNYTLNEMLIDELAETIAREFAERTGYASKKAVDAYYVSMRSTHEDYRNMRHLYDAMVKKVVQNKLCSPEAARRLLTHVLLISGHPQMPMGGDKRLFDFVSDTDAFYDDLAFLAPDNINEFIRKHLENTPED